MIDRSHFEKLDQGDSLAFARDRFRVPEGLVYLDGNSLGPLPTHVPGRLAQVAEVEWGQDLIRSWNANGWWELARAVGDRLAPLIGVPAGSVIAGDTTTVAVYKAAAAARRLRADRAVILTDSGNFPTDLYALSSVAQQFDAILKVVEPGEVLGAIGDHTAVVCLTHVDYRTGRRHDMAGITRAASAAGAVMVWDLSHSTGAMDLDLSGADMAVGCGYKYLNGGPGAPAFTYVHERHHESFANPIAGWWAHAEPFAMAPAFLAVNGIERIQVGTQPILSLAAFHSALEAFDGVEPGDLRRKSERLTSEFIDLVEADLPEFEIVTPRNPDDRGSHVSLAHPEANRIMRTLIAADVIGDVRPPNLLRFGFAPLYQRFVDLWEAVDRLRHIMDNDHWRDAPDPRGAVT